MPNNQGLAVFGADAYTAAPTAAPRRPLGRPPAAVPLLIAAAAGYGLWRAHSRHLKGAKPRSG